MLFRRLVLDEHRCSNETQEQQCEDVQCAHLGEDAMHIASGETALLSVDIPRSATK